MPTDAITAKRNPSAPPSTSTHDPPSLRHLPLTWTSPIFRWALLRKMRFVGVYAKNASLTSEMVSFCTPGILFDVGRSMLGVGCSGHMTSRLAVSRINHNKTWKNRRDVKVGHSAPCGQWRNGNIQHRTSNIQHRTKMGELHFPCLARAGMSVLSWAHTFNSREEL